MFEKVNPSHPDKLADRIAGAIVDLAYTKDENPKIAVEILIGHGICHIVAESSVHIGYDEVSAIVKRIAGKLSVDFTEVPQDIHLADNQSKGLRCCDNGIFKGTPVTEEQKKLTSIAKDLYDKYRCDGKYILDNNRLIICQSNADVEKIKEYTHVMQSDLEFAIPGSDDYLIIMNEIEEMELLDAVCELRQWHYFSAKKKLKAIVSKGGTYKETAQGLLNNLL